MCGVAPLQLVRGAGITGCVGDNYPTAKNILIAVLFILYNKAGWLTRHSLCVGVCGGGERICKKTTTRLQTDLNAHNMQKMFFF